MVEVEHEGGNGSGSQSRPCSGWNPGDAWVLCLRGRRSSYLLEGLRGALSHTTIRAGADPSLRPAPLIAVP